MARRGITDSPYSGTPGKRKWKKSLLKDGKKWSSKKDLQFFCR
jgi:hypothetical protein